MNKFRFFIVFLIVIFSGILLYLEVIVEGNRVVSESTSVLYDYKYVDADGKLVTTTDPLTLEILSSDKNVKISNAVDFTTMPVEMQDAMKGKKQGDKVTYTAEPNESDVNADFKSPYTYTATITGVRNTVSENKEDITPPAISPTVETVPAE